MAEPLAPQPHRHLRLVLDEQERERSDLANRLHDQLAQSLAAVLLGLQGLERRAPAEEAGRLAALGEQLGDALSLCTELATCLRPAALDELGLAPALVSLAERAGATRTGVGPALAAARFERGFETEVYRSVEEALVAAGPGCGLSASLAGHGGEICVSVGPLPGKLRPERLDALEARLELIGGSMEHGVRGLTMRIPVPDPRPIAAFPQARRVETTDGARSTLT